MIQNYDETLSLCKETGKGLTAERFQETSNYTMAKNDYDCPHCGAYHGHKIVDEITIKDCSIIGETYELPIDVEFMCTNTGYSWTEDVQCSNCNEMYSRGNGC